MTARPARRTVATLALLAATAVVAALLLSAPLRDRLSDMAPPMSSVFPSDTVPDGGAGLGALSREHARLAQAVIASVLLTGAMAATVLVARTKPAPARLSSLVPDSLPAQKDALARLERLGIAGAPQFLAFDPDTLAFWSGMPAGDVSELQGLVRLLEWPAVPKPTAQRLAEAGVASIPALAVQEPDALAETLRQSMGARLAEPACDPQAIAAWIVAARRHVAGEPNGAGPYAMPRPAAVAGPWSA